MAAVSVKRSIGIKCVLSSFPASRAASTFLDKSGMRTYLGKIEVTLLAGYFCSPGNFFVTDFLSGSSGHVIVTAVQVLLRTEKKLQFI